MSLKTEYLYNATVTNVVDGDTIDVTIDLGFNIFSNMRLRLNGVDTKETNSKISQERELAQKAKEFVIHKILNKKVLLETFKPDKYGRYLANVYIDNNIDSFSINTMLINEGLAVPYFGDAK